MRTLRTALALTLAAAAPLGAQIQFTPTGPATFAGGYRVRNFGNAGDLELFFGTTYNSPGRQQRQASTANAGTGLGANPVDFAISYTAASRTFDFSSSRFPTTGGAPHALRV